MHSVVLRIHLTSEDLARMRVARTPDPMWETVLGLRVLGNRRAQRCFDGWRRHTLSRLTSQTRRLCDLIPPDGPVPDFLTPTCGEISPQGAVGQIVATSAEQLRTEVRELGGAWADTLTETGCAGLGRLGDALLSFFDIGIAPYWLRILAAADGARAAMARTLLDSGIERMLMGLWPGASWQPPVLELPHSCDRELRPDGREVVLLPSYFAAPAPLTRRDPTRSPVLVFPVRGAAPGDALARSGAAQPAADAKLAALLGRTRAAVLATAATACTTSELARRVGISLASASQHATVLREAGLLTTVRHRNAVVHTTTALGTALITRR